MTTRSLWSSRRRLAVLEGQHRQRAAVRRADLQHAMTEAFGNMLMNDYGLPLSSWDRHGQELLALAAAELDAEPHIGVMLARGEEHFTQAMRAAVVTLFAFHDGRAVLRLDDAGAGSEPPPWSRPGFTPYLRDAGSGADVVVLAAELRKLEADRR